MGKKTKAQRLLEEAMAIDALMRVLEPQPMTLANPAFGTHALVMFAIEHKILFMEWANEGADETVGDGPKTEAEIDRFLKAAHATIHQAMVASLIELPNGANVRLRSVGDTSHVRPIRRDK